MNIVGPEEEQEEETISDLSFFDFSVVSLFSMLNPTPTSTKNNTRSNDNVQRSKRIFLLKVFVPDLVLINIENLSSAQWITGLDRRHTCLSVSRPADRSNKRSIWHLFQCQGEIIEDVCRCSRSPSIIRASSPAEEDRWMINLVAAGNTSDVLSSISWSPTDVRLLLPPEHSHNRFFDWPWNEIRP